MAGKHDRGSREGKFCAVPAKPKCTDCPGSKDYIAVCEPPEWFDHTFSRLVSAKVGPFTFAKKYEAHHVLCVAPVSDKLVSNSAIEGVIKQTKWCINNEQNMLAMPLWGHTVKWYCKDIETKKMIPGGLGAPPFADIPQHDFDHNCNGGYTDDIRKACDDLVEEIEEAEHELKGDSLVGRLNQLSGKWKNELVVTRGKRKGGTHAAWAAAQGATADPQWCHPFSMASEGKVSSIGFPVRNFNDEVMKWINRIADAINSGV